MRRLLVASGNRKKLEELRRRLAGMPVEIVSPADLDPPPRPPDEPFATFVENAEHKALEYARASGMLALADDSGLEVDALGGRPGVDSAYYAGRPTDDEKNNDKLLDDLAATPDGRRTARYRCVLALAVPGRVLLAVDGSCEGTIGRARRGAGGFGYDPLFLVGDGSKSFGELSPEEKDRISHRGRAMERLRAALGGVLARNPSP